MPRKGLYLALLIAAGLPILCSAQPPTDYFAHQRRQRGEIEARVRTMKIWKMTEELDLSEEQATRFFPIMQAMEEKQDAVEQERRQTLDKLGDLVWKENADAGEINSLLDQLEKLGGEEIAIRKQFRKDVSNVLTPPQMGKMVLFNQRFPMVMRDMIRDFEDRVPPPPPGPPGPPKERGF